MPVHLGRAVSVVCFALATLAPTAVAQNRIAVISLQRFLNESVEIKKASAAMEAKYKPRQAEIEKVQKDIEAIEQQLRANAGKLTPQAEGDLTARGQRRQRDLQRLTEDLQQDVERERNEILSRSRERLVEVVRQVAEAKGLDVVVEMGNTFYAKPSIDITAEAIAAYDKSAAAPATK